MVCCALVVIRVISKRPRVNMHFRIQSEFSWPNIGKLAVKSVSWHRFVLYGSNLRLGVMFIGKS